MVPVLGQDHAQESNRLVEPPARPYVTARAEPHRHRGRHPPRRPRVRRIRYWPDQSDRPARRHRPLRRGQDGLHHRAGASVAAWRAAAGVRGAERRPHHPRAPRAAAGRRGATLRLRGASARVGRRAALAGIDHAHQRASPRHRVSVGAARRAQSHADPRYRRLSGRMAARPAAARDELCAMVGGYAEAFPPRASRGAGGGVASPPCDA